MLLGCMGPREVANVVLVKFVKYVQPKRLSSVMDSEVFGEKRDLCWRAMS